VTERDVWDGRPVTFASLSILEGEPIIEAFGRGDGKRARYALLVASMRWADSGEPVFSSVDEIYAQPLRAWLTLVRLGNKAGFVNGLQDDDPDALPPPGNGHDRLASADPSS
jgi:hypothetical protein